MNQPYKIELLYGFKCIRPEHMTKIVDNRCRPGQYLEYTGTPPVRMSVSRPRCDYCGHPTHPDGYKCKSCGAPS